MSPLARFRAWGALAGWVALVATAQAANVVATNPYAVELESARRELTRRRGRPEAIAPLAAALRLDERVASEDLAALVHGTADDPGTEPLVAAQASYAAAAMDDARGDATAARARRRALGLLDDAWIIGPFEAQGRAGLDVVYPPETGELDVSAANRLVGKEHEVSWRRATAGFASGALLVDALVRPDRDALAYVLVKLHADRDRTVALRVGSSGPVKVWVNGGQVLSRDAVRSARLDQDAAPAALRAGDNLVLIKTVSGESGWRMLARVTEPDGRPCKGVAWSAEPAALRPAARPPGPALTAPRSLVRALNDRAQARGGKDAAAWLDLAELLALLEPDDEQEKSAERAASRALELDPTGAVGVRAALLLGELAREDDDRRDALERVLPRLAARERALVLSSLGDLARGARRDSAAFSAWRDALTADPGCWPATLAIAAEEQAVGMPWAAWQRVQALAPDVRKLPRVRRVEARLLEAIGKPREAVVVLEALSEQRRNDVEVLQSLATLERTLRGPAAAAQRLTTLAQARPDLTFVPIELARLHEGAGEAERATAVLTATLARLPDDARLAEELGKLLARQGKTADSLVWLRRSLELRPQNPTLRRLADRLSRGGGSDGDAAADLARHHAEDALPIARASLRAGPRPAERGDAAVVLLDRRVVRVHDNGLSDVFAQRIVEVRSETGARSLNRFYVRYTPGDQEVEIRRARMLRRGPNGDLISIEATGRQDEDLSEPWYGLYYDNRAVVVEFDGLRAGDVLELQYTVSDTASRNELGGYFGDFQFLAETLPTRRWEYTLLAPRRRSFYFHVPTLSSHGGTLTREEADVGAERMHRFIARDVARVDVEPSMPGLAEIAPYLHVSTFAGWDEVGRWYWQLVRDQLAADDAVRRAALAAVAGATTELDKVRALHRLVVAGTRYVGLEFGIHGYKPYRVSQVLARRFGDCKDKASLLVALLREAGIEAQLVLVRTRRGGNVAPQPASLAVFDHAIAYVPRLDLYLDGTAEFSGMAELPSQDQGVMVLRVDARGATLVQTPVLPSNANRAARRWNVTLARDGSARIDERLTISGQAAPEWRQHYEAVGERLDRYGKVWNGRLPGTRIESLEFGGIDDRNHPVELRAALEVPRFAEATADGGIELPIAARDAEFVRSYARLSSRKHDLVLGFPWQHEETIETTLPPGLRIGRAPAPRRIEGPFGKFVLDVSRGPDGRAITIRSSLDVVRYRVAPAEYVAFRRFLGEVDAALSDHVTLVKGAP